MPPKPKYTKEKLVEAAFEITVSCGYKAVTARSIAKKLNASAASLFTHIDSLDELDVLVRAEALKELNKYLAVADSFNPTFKMRGMQMIKFAQDYPMLFRLLFMDDFKTDGFDEFMQKNVYGYSEDIENITLVYGLTYQQAKHLFDHIWLHTYGISVLCASKVRIFTENDIAAELGETFAGMLMVLKSGMNAKAGNIPAQKFTPEGEKMGGIMPIIK